MPGRPLPLSEWEERRRRLLRSACLEVAEQGVDGLTLERVARRSGVSKGAVQYAFGSREELLGALARWVLTSIWSDGVGAVDDDGNTRELAGVVSGMSRGLSVDEARLYALVSLLGASRRYPAIRDALHAFYAELDPSSEAALDAVVPFADDHERAALVRGVRGVALGMFVHWTVHPQGRSPDDVAHEVDVVLRHFLGVARAAMAHGGQGDGVAP